MRTGAIVCFLAVLTSLSACAVHRSYDTAQFREREVQYSKIALDKDGLSKEQIEIITSTKPPKSFPVDISVVILKNRYLDSGMEDVFTYNVVAELGKSEKIKRITLVPDFLIPNPLSFNAIQELGVRSLSEYVIVLNIDGSELFQWTNILKDKWEISSAVNYIIVDSFTSAMLTSNKLFRTEEYYKNLFELGERRKAQEILFSQQAKLLAANIEELFAGSK